MFIYNTYIGTFYLSKKKTNFFWTSWNSAVRFAGPCRTLFIIYPPVNSIDAPVEALRDFES